MGQRRQDRPPETAEEIALAEIGMERRRYYEQNYRPMEESFIRETMGDEQRLMNQGAGLAAVDQAMNMGRLVEPLEAAQVRAGAGLGSDRFGLSVANQGLQTGIARGLAVTDAEQAARDVQTGNLLSLVQTGRGVGGQALQGIANIADISSRQAIMDARAAAAARRATGQLVGAGIGAGLGMWNGGGGSTDYFGSANTTTSAAQMTPANGQYSPVNINYQPGGLGALTGTGGGGSF